MGNGASQSIGPRAILDDPGITYAGPLQINTNADAAAGTGNRLGIGKVRHIEVHRLWLQDKVYKGEIILQTIGTLENIADSLTEAAHAETVQ